MLRYWLLCWMVPFWFLVPGPSASAQPRIALVVGVGAYVAAPPLTNPRNDATDLAAALTRLGFETELVIDPDRPTLEAAVRRFGGRARGADAAVFYYAGHALEASGRNWLLPRTANITSDRDLRFEALDADSVLEQVEGAARVTVVILDACRDNPFRMAVGGGTRSTGERGLAPPRAAIGTLISFATAPGTVAEDGRGRNSPFATALLRHVETPGLELRQMMGEVRREVREATQGRQIPWEHSSLEGAFYFRPPAPPTAPAAAPRATGPSADAMFWESMRGSNDPQDFRAYLEQFPQGVFAPLARNRLAQLGHATEPVSAAALTRAMARVMPEATAAQGAALFMESPMPLRAIAAAQAGRGFFSLRGFDDPAVTREVALERCQVFHNIPCAIIAEGDSLLLPAAGAAAPWPFRDMPRTRHAGRFDAEQVPGRSPSQRRVAWLLAYGTNATPRAMVYNPWTGGQFPVTEAANETAAATEAFRQCTAQLRPDQASAPCILYAVGDRVVLPRRLRNMAEATAAGVFTPPAATPAANAPASSLSTQLISAMAPIMGQQSAERGVQAYFSLPGPNRALTLNIERRDSWAGGGFSSVEEATEAVLERCQVTHGSPCVLVTAGDAAPAAQPSMAARPRHDMPRVRYAGSFDPAQLPGQAAVRRRDQALVLYAAATGPKAAAFHPFGGRFFSSTGAASEAAAAAQALQRCNDDPERAGRDGPCFLYAVSDRVVLPRRLRNVAEATAAGVFTPPAATPAANAPAPSLSTQLISAMAPVMGQQSAERGVETYFRMAGPNRALALNIERRNIWTGGGFSSVEGATEAVLERCQVTYGSPCVLVTAGDAAPAAQPSMAARPRHDMPRVRYAGSFDPAQFPGRSAEHRRDQALALYAAATGPKAAAFHPFGGRFFSSTGAASEAAAAAQALQRCNDDPERAGRDGPCFLYALGNQVVLPQRRTAVTP